MKRIGLAFLLLAFLLPSVYARDPWSDPWTALGGGALDGVKLARWHSGYLERCYFHEGLPLAAPAGMHTDLADLADLAALLTSEPTLGAPLLETAARFGVPVCIEDRYHSNLGAFDLPLHIVLLDDQLDLAQRAVILVHELRHVDRASRGFTPSLDYSMASAVRLTLAGEADAQAVATLYAWRMKQRGSPEIWEALLAFERYADIASSFERSMASNPSELDATRAAFAQWYVSEWRVSTYQRNASWGYLDRQDETKLIPRSGEFPGDYFDEFCFLPGGEDYGGVLVVPVWAFPLSDPRSGAAMLAHSGGCVQEHRPPPPARTPWVSDGRRW